VNVQLKILFDECLGKPMMEELKQQLLPDDPLFAHLTDFFSSGTPDSEWIPKLAKDGWIVISTDGAKKKNRGGKLPEICKSMGITHIIMSPTLHKRNSRDKIAAIALVWEQIKEAGKATPGTRFNLQFRVSNVGVLSVALVLATQS
jgi:hypothetical protein